MWPWAHLAVAYLVYAGIVRARTGGRPGDVPAIAVAVGSQAPDLIDKPFGWYVGVLPGGRSLGHSLVVAAIVLVPLTIILRDHRRFAAWVAFVVGYATHVAADVVDPLRSGQYADLAFLAWPVTALPTTGGPASVGSLVASMEPTPYAFLQLALTVAGLLVWIHQGRPGLAPVRQWLGGRGSPG